MRHLLTAGDLDTAAAVQVLDTAAAMAETQSREIKKLPTLRGRTVVNLFFEDSTRTRISFEAAAKRLSADVINFSAKGSSVSAEAVEYCRQRDIDLIAGACPMMFGDGVDFGHRCMRWFMGVSGRLPS